MTAILDFAFSKPGETLVFFVLVSFTVVSLTMLEEHRAKVSSLVDAGLALAFLAMAGSGALGFAAGAPRFLPLAFLITGLAGLGILAGQVLDRGKELRRIAAKDL